MTRDGTAETVSRDRFLRHERGQGNIHFSSSADHEQDWQPYPIDPYSCYIFDHTYIHTYIHVNISHVDFGRSCTDFWVLSGEFQNLHGAALDVA